jgi:hypothetical protein
MSLLLAMILAGAAPAPCIADRERLLALDPRAFDQDLEGGWRAVALREECQSAAADLIRDYRRLHGLSDSILYWHEGQLRALAGETKAAIALFERSRKGPGDRFGWDAYVDATIAFLRHDRRALMAARESLARLPRPADFDPRDPQGHPLRMAWPVNLDVVDGFIACFGRTYVQAYGPACRAPATRGVEASPAKHRAE